MARFAVLRTQFKIMIKPVISSLAPSLFRLGLVLLGVIIGMVWAYQGAPVKFHDGEPVQLEQGFKDQWIKGAAAELAWARVSGNAQAIQDAEDEAKRKIVDAGIEPAAIDALMKDNPQLADELQELKKIAEENKDAAAEQAGKAESSTLRGLLGPLACVFGTMIFGVILAFVLTFYWAVPIGKWAKGAVPAWAGAGAGMGVPGVHAERIAVQKAVADQKTDFAAVGEAPPISQYMSTYIVGDDLYDDSFSIETPSGEFLGECGSGISETIGVGDPKKVTASEVWLFDKNDIRTVTKVLMSEHAFNDQALRTKLAPKGEAVLAKAGDVTLLETQTLRVQVRVIDLQYGEGALPPNSFFERLTVEIAAWRRDDGGGGEGDLPTPPDTSTAFGDTAELLNY